ncbi:NADH-quinone oxidoreductase subunit C [Candidatus Methylacidithermus pantelleriae]|uniref:NADH-quinone oxidoreductase subunit C n=1 Tax=Candidatus Methylacidithermus pantelleriae TaxID=2744239 RepID=A0A8J2BN13_9BACT|nr:NADH-quinone oxidoreductase subunit C [Candidatus Methylacidithermus pantelleriae]CAF0691961.1 NADH-quinone oxidoreductase subunit C [Candidatus Methylacidithermus pantelleriae]
MKPELASVLDTLQARFEQKTFSVREFRGETTVQLDRWIVRDVARFLKEERGFRFLLDITAVDHLPEKPRFEVVYHFYHLDLGLPLRIKARVPEEDPTVPSLVPVYATANWHEREAYDMMGLRFEGHPDLRRILMWEGYPYFPLRKDFPLEGKWSDEGEIAFSRPAPLEGGPFVSQPGRKLAMEREPRAQHVAKEEEEAP